ncbi:hypothetical protein F4802DRAFT_562763 [Xylaria palmicola]|nr:hypothetical protein F4802DRAFT_562763 [Xylaria palmicola]
MSAASRAGLRGLVAAVQKPSHRCISWMPFEMPNTALYTPPPSLQPKRPATAETAPGADGSSLPISPMTVAARTPAQTQEASMSGKIVPVPVPASAMRTGPVPLSQIQKRTLITTQYPPTSTK